MAVPPVSAFALEQLTTIENEVTNDDDSLDSVLAEEPVLEEPIPEEQPEEQPEELPETSPKPDFPEKEDLPESSVPDTEQDFENPNQVEPPEESAPTPVPPVKEDSNQGNQSTPNQQGKTNPVTEKTEFHSEKAVFQVTPVQRTWDFIHEIGEDARKVAQENDLYASVMIAQAILESNSGQSQLSQAPYFNLFGIKGRYQGNGESFSTQEDDGNGNFYTINAVFRQYADFEESFDDYAELLRNGLTYDQDFYKGTWKSETTTYEEATEFLTGRYATDHQYQDKLNALIEAYALVYYDQPAEDVEASQSYAFPVDNPVISSDYGPRWGSFHRGVDFAAPMGSPIYASQSGVIIRAEYHESWGNYIAIQHMDGWVTLYAHNSQNLVNVGQSVKQGEKIATIGSTGNSTGPHLHFEVIRSSNFAQDQLIDPLTILGK
jgi:flagellum-specific peptidoglycan hydrolase FlgJ